MFSELFYNILKHLFPRSRAFRFPKNKELTQFIEGLSGFQKDHKDYSDQILLDAFPATTRELDLQEKEFGIIPYVTTAAVRRQALAQEWEGIKGQHKDNLEQALQQAGFNVYVHEVIPAQDPATWINVNPITVSGETDAKAGETNKVAGYNGGALLKNGPLFSRLIQYYATSGEPEVFAGELEAITGDIRDVVFNEIPETIPIDPDEWPYIFYISDSTFPNYADVDAAREAEFKTLILKLKPVNTWAGLLITYT